MSKRSGLVGSDVDAELFNYFNGGYAAELGLKSSTGAQLDRLSFKLGPSAVRIPDGYNDNVRFDLSRGPAGYVEATKVAMAMRRVGELEKSAEHFAALHGYYLRRPHGAYEGLHAYGEYAGVAFHVRRTRTLVAEHCKRELARELTQNREAIASSRVGNEERLGMLRGRLRVLLANKPTAHRFAEQGVPALGEEKPPRVCRDCGAKESKPQLGEKPKKAVACWRGEKRRIDAELSLPSKLGIKYTPPSQDTEEALRRKWAKGGDDLIAEVLRSLAKASRGPKEGPERQQAKDAQEAILDEAKAAWKAARAAYAEARKQVDRDIRAARDARREAPDAAFLASLEYVPADQD